MPKTLPIPLRKLKQIPQNDAAIAAQATSHVPIRNMLLQRYNNDEMQSLNQAVHGAEVRVRAAHQLGIGIFDEDSRPATRGAMYDLVNEQVPYRSRIEDIDTPYLASATQYGQYGKPDETGVVVSPEGKIAIPTQEATTWDPERPQAFVHEQSHMYQLPRQLPNPQTQTGRDAAELAVEVAPVLSEVALMAQAAERARGRGSKRLERRLKPSSTDDWDIDRQYAYAPKFSFISDMSKKHTRLGTGDMQRELSSPAGQRWLKLFLDSWLGKGAKPPLRDPGLPPHLPAGMIP